MQCKERRKITMTAMPWFRVYSDIMTDRKISRICKKTGQSRALVIGLWICLLSLANESPKRGQLFLADDIPYTIDDLEDETGLPTEIVSQLIEEFRSFGMISGSGVLRIENWDKRQYKSDSSTQRVREHRAKKSVTENETLQKRYSNLLDTETESDTDTESDTETESETTTSSRFGELVKAYEANIGAITQMTADMLADDLEQYGLQLCLDAILEAVKQNKRKWSYVRGILKNWWADGRTSADPKPGSKEKYKIVLPDGQIVEAKA
jgi:DnaD/phage-associated family protein